MQYVEYGAHNLQTVILLRGGGLSWWNYRDVAQLLSDRFHVFLPILDGHADSDAPFTSIEDNAARIIAHIDQYFGSKEQSSIRTSGKLLNRMIPDSTLESLPGYNHGDLSLNHPQAYAQMLLTLIR